MEVLLSNSRAVSIIKSALINVFVDFRIDMPEIVAFYCRWVWIFVEALKIKLN